MKEDHLNPPDDLEITVVPTRQLDRATKAEIVALCNRAFSDEEFDELFDLVASASDPVHVMARLDGRLVSHAMWSTRILFLEDGTRLRAAYVDAVATEPGQQGQGIGTAVVRRLTDEILDYDIGCLSTNRITFYARIGWDLWSGPKGVKTEVGVAFTPNENVMIWRTPHTPLLDQESLLVVERRRGDPW